MATHDVNNAQELLVMIAHEIDKCKAETRQRIDERSKHIVAEEWQRFSDETSVLRREYDALVRALVDEQTLKPPPVMLAPKSHIKP